MLKKVILFSLMSVFSFASTVYLACAANVSYALPSLIKAFNKEYPNIHIKTVLSSSGKLTAQIKHGAPFDVFMSANMKYPNFLYKNGLAITKPKVYAMGAIALFSTKIKNLSMKSLLKANEIAIANPKTAPYGRAALEAMKNAHIYNKVKSKLVYAETVTAVIPYTVNSADIGIVAKSSLYSPKIKNIGKFYAKDINPKLYKPIKQGIVILKGANKDAYKFYDFILSKKAAKIFKKYGYMVNE
jgi:molybdate transport system substrate-binding protein